MMEEWRAVTTHEGYYEVSNCGRVRSVARTVFVSPSTKHPNGCHRPIRARVLALNKSSGDRRTVSLWREHVVRIVSVSVLVLEAFVGPRPIDKPYGCHEDDNTTNNHLTNLYWGTPKQNSADKIRNGNQAYGEDCAAAKLTQARVAALRSKAGTASQEQLGREHGISQAQVSRILNERHWR